MKTRTLRRALSLLLSLAMLLSVLAGLSLPASAVNYAYNSGVRGVACTSLSSAALSYWTGTYSFANLNAQSGDTLRSTLRAKITSNRSTVGYDGLKTYFPYTDAYQGSSSQITLFYANRPTSSAWNAELYWNREHMWPDSLGGGAVDGDLHSMRPTDKNANSTRGNAKYANVREMYPESYKTATTNDTNGSVIAGYYYSNTYFEPLDVSKGDAARVLLYDYVVTDSMSSPTVAIKDIQTLLEWHAMDPVDEYEMQRNDIVQTIQGCRNPFVDYPELAWRLYSSYTMPTNMTTPSSGSAFVVNASTNNSSYGTVSVNGCIITASPNTGYYASGYTILSGEASVSQNGNTFTVTPTTNCSIRINFAAKHAVTVTLSANGATSTQSGYAGEAMSLPTATAPTGYGFVGWVTSAVAETSAMPETIYSGTFTPAGSSNSITLYALYSHSGSGSGSGYTLVGADNFTEGTYLIGALRSSTATNDFYFATGSTDSGDMLVTDTAVTIAETNGARTVTTPPSGAAAFYFTGNNTNGFTIAPATNATNYLGFSSNASRKLAFGSSYSTTKWRVAAKSGSLLTNGVYLSCASDTNYTISENSTLSTAIRGYANTTVYRAIYLFKQGGSGTLTYTTSPGTVCSHTYGAWTSNNNGTHSKTCSLCGDVVTESCNYTTSTSGATTTYTCSVCGHSYQTQLSTYTVTYNDRGSTTSVSCAQGSSVTLPSSASTLTGYAFVGWVDASIATETTTAPTVRTGSYTPGGDVTLYACYTRTEAGQSTAASYQLVTAEKNNWSGKYLIAYSDSVFADGRVGGTGTGGMGAQNVSVAPGSALSGTTVSAEWGDQYCVELVTVNGGYVMKTLDGKYNYQTNNSNGLQATTTQSTAANYLLRVTFHSSSNIGIANSAGAVFHYNTQGYFRFYKDGGQKAVYLYERVSGSSGSTTYYTTLPAVSEPEPAFVSAAPVLNGKIDMNYTVSVPSGYTNPCMTFTFNGTTTTVTDYTTENGNLKFSFTGINPQCMGDTITATLSATKDGTTHTVSNASYSVRSYCVSKLADDSISDSLRKLLSDLLAYGAAAQTFMGYKTNALVTDGNDISDPSYSMFSAISDNTASFRGTANADYCWISAGLTLTDSVAMVFRFHAAAVDKLTVYVALNGREQVFTSFTSEGNGVYSVALTGISAEEFGDTVTATMEYDDAQVGEELHYTVNAYVQAKQADTETANLAALVRALYNYGAAAVNYVTYG